VFRNGRRGMGQMLLGVKEEIMENTLNQKFIPELTMYHCW
jgi:hypothetical protein